MSICQSHAVTLTVNASGDGTAYTDPVNGRILQIFYEPGTLVTGTDLVITGEDTGLPILTIANIGTSALLFQPRIPTRDNAAGAASLYAAAGEPVEDLIWIGGERIKIVVDEGGNATTGTITFWIG